MPDKKNIGSNLQGATRLVTDATTGITDVVEAMHKRIVHPPFLPSTPIQHLITKIAALTFRNIRWTTQTIGGSIDKLLGKLVPMVGELKSSDQQEAMRAALNGVIGDYLEKTGNPLQIKMQLRHQAKALNIDTKDLDAAYPDISGKILLMVHGSSMNDIQWTQKNHNHGSALAKEFDKTPVFLHYNSGRHISSNGKDLNELLETLAEQWPVPIQELVIIAHSMGGLLTRSALYYGRQQDQSWTKHLKKMIFLGTPHHGSPLEKTGNYVDAILEAIPYTKPLAQLGKIRSAGVTDLRFGNLIDEDWQGTDRFERLGDQRQHIPLPLDIEAYSIAASKGRATTPITDRIPGDGLVGIKSALGRHKDPTKNVYFKEEHTWITYESTHLDLLNSSQVYAKMKEWLA